MKQAAVKVIKWVSAGLTVAVLVLAGYFVSRNEKYPKPLRRDTAPLPEKVVSAAYKIHYSEHRQGKPFLEVLAERNVASRDNTHHLKGIRAKYLGDSTTEPTLIEAEECQYNAADNSIRFQGAVTVTRPSGGRLTSRNVSLEKGRDFVSGEEPFAFEKPGIQASGKGFALDLKTRDLEIRSEARVDYLPAAGPAPPNLAKEGRIRLRASRATVKDAEKTVLFSDGCTLESDLSFLQGATMTARGTPENRCREVQATGGAVCRRREGKSSLTLSGGDLRFGLAPDGQALDAVTASGKAALNLDGSLLTGDQIVVKARSDGILDKLQATGQVRFTGVAQQGTAAGDALTAVFSGANALSRMEIVGKAEVTRREGKTEFGVWAARLTFVFRSGPSTRPVLESSLAEGGCTVHFSGADGARLNGSCGVLSSRYAPSGQFPLDSEARGKCDFRINRPAGGESARIRAERALFGFFPASSDIQTLDASGNVRLSREKAGAAGVESQSDRMQAAFSPEDRGQIRSLVQTGHFSYADKGRNVTAGEARFEGETATLTGKPEIRTPDGVLKATLFLLNEKAGTINGRGAVEAERFALSPAGQPGFSLGGSPKGRGTKVWIQAENVVVEEKTGQARFSGKCRMTQGEGVLNAETFTLRQDGSFSAEGGVRAVMSLHDEKKGNTVVNLAAGRLSYAPRRKKLLLEGAVDTRTVEGKLLSDSLWGFFDEAGDVKTLFARGKVSFHQADRRAFGDTVVYEVGSGNVLLGGKPARVVELKTGRSTSGARLTFRQGDENVLIEQSGAVALVE